MSKFTRIGTHRFTLDAEKEQEQEQDFNFVVSSRKNRNIGAQMEKMTFD